jgi:hypothetical protein
MRENRPKFFWEHIHSFLEKTPVGEFCSFQSKSLKEKEEEEEDEEVNKNDKLVKLLKIKRNKTDIGQESSDDSEEEDSNNETWEDLNLSGDDLESSFNNNNQVNEYRENSESDEEGIFNKLN